MVMRAPHERSVSCAGSYDGIISRIMWRYRVTARNGRGRGTHIRGRELAEGGLGLRFVTPRFDRYNQRRARGVARDVEAEGDGLNGIRNDGNM